MKKSIVSLMICLLVLGFTGSAWSRVVADDVACTECVNDTDMATGAVTEPKLASGAVTNEKIADGAVTSSKVSDGVITETKIGNAAVTETKMSSNAVSTTKIADGAVTNNKLADWSVSDSKIVDFSITDIKISSNAISTGKIADGAVTDAKIVGPISGSKLGNHTHDGTDIIDGTVATSKISDGAITDAKISGPISTSKLNLGTTPDSVAAGDHNHDALYQKKYGNVVVVAKSGGDFTSIQAAIDSINPTAENPYLIKVMPGIYSETVSLKSFVHLQGAGQQVTTIVGDYTVRTIQLTDLTNVMISGLTVKNGYAGIYISNSSSVTITENTISNAYWDEIVITDSSASVMIDKNTITAGGHYAIATYSSSSVTITGNTITENFDGITCHSAANVTIIENTISKNGRVGFGGNGISNTSASTLISGNTISENAYDGIYNGYGAESAKIVNNTIVNNNRADISVWNSVVPNISFNSYDTIIGTTGVGLYNVKSDGTAAPEP